MTKRVPGEQPAARRALQEALLNEERLDDLLDCVARLGERRSDGVDADRTAAVVERNGRKIAAVHRVHAGGVDLKREQRLVGDRAVDCGCARNMREVAHALEQPPGDARGAARAARDLVGAVLRHRNAEDARAAVHDQLQLLARIEIEPHRNAETVAQRSGEQAGAGRRADQREAREIDLHRARRRPLADDQIELEVLHGGIEDFLDRGVEPVDLVDEQHVALFQVGEQRRKIAGLGDDGT